MGEKTEAANAAAKGALKKIKASGGKLQGNFYYAGTGKGSSDGAGLVVTLTSRDRKGTKALTEGKGIRKEIKGAKFGRGTVTMSGGKLTFTLFSGSASAGHLKKDFKKTLSVLDGLKLLKASVIKKQGDAKAEEIGDASERAEADEPITLTDKEREELAELELEQAAIADLNGQLSEFLSAESAAKDLTEQITATVQQLDVLDPRKDPEAHRAAQRELAELLDIGPDPFPNLGDALPPELFHLLAISASLVAGSFAPPEDSTRYESLSAKVELELNTLAGLMGATDPTYTALRARLGAAQRLALGTRPPSYARGAELLAALLPDCIAATRGARDKHQATREAAASLEADRLKALRERLDAESKLRLLSKNIEAFRARLPKKKTVPLAAIRPPLRQARSLHGEGSAELKDEAVLALSRALPAESGRETISVALAQIKVSGQKVEEGTEQLDKARELLDSRESESKKSDLTGPLMARVKKLGDQIRARELLPAEDTDPLHEALHTIRHKLIDKPARAQLGPIGKELDAVQGRLDQLVEDYDTRRSAAAEVVERASEALYALQVLLLPGETFPLQQRLDAARRALEASKTYDEARALSEALISDIRAQLPGAKAARARWDAHQIKALQQRIQVQQDLASQLSFPHNPSALNYQLQATNSAVTQRSTAYAEGATLLDELKVQIDANSAFLDDHETLGSDQAWAARIDQAKEAASQALSSLRLGLEGMGIDPGLIETAFAPLEAEQAALTARWEALRPAVPTLKYPDRLVALLTDLEELSAAVKARGDNIPETLDAARAPHARGRLEALAGQGEALIQKLRDLGSDKVIGHTTALEAAIAAGLELTAPDQQEAAADALEGGLLEEMQREQQELSEQRSALKKTLKKTLEQAEADMAVFEAAVAEETDRFFRGPERRGLGKKYTAYVGSLRRELGELKMTADTDYVGLIREVIAGLVAFIAGVAQASRGLGELATDPGDGSPTSITTLFHNIEKEEERIGKEVAHLPQAKKALLDDFKTLKDELGGELVDVSQKRFGVLEQKGRQLIKASQDWAIEKTSLTVDADRIIKQLDQKPVVMFDILKADLEKQFAMLRRNISQEGGHEDARTTLAEIKARLEKARSGSGLQEMVTELDTRARESQQQKTEWEAALSAFNRELFDPYEDEVKSGMSLGSRFVAFFSDPDKIKEIKQLKSAAEKAAKDGDYQMARYQLSLARGRMEFHLRFPEGQDAAVLADINRIPARWRGALSEFRKGLDTATEAIAGGLEATQGAAVRKAGAALRGLLPSDVFDKVTEGLKDPDASTKRAAREQGLAEVRRLRGVLAHPQIRILADAPFEGVDFTGHFEVGKALLDLEKTILLSADSNA